MTLEEKYISELNTLRGDKGLLSDLSIESSVDKNRNQVKRNRILIALYNDLKEEDYSIVDFIFNEEKKLRQSSDLEVIEYEVEVLYLAAYLLTVFNRIEDVWKFIAPKTTDFDSAVGFDTEFLLSFGVERTREYLLCSNHPHKEIAIHITGAGLETSPYSQEEIDSWKFFKSQYFLVFKFPIVDEVDFSFQSKEYEHLKKILPAWMAKIDNWTEDQHLTAIAIGRRLQLDDVRLAALKSYNRTFQNQVRIKRNLDEIREIEKHL